MNYEPNQTDWEVGDIVIHDADAKNERMLMMVIQTDRPDDQIATVYINRRDAEQYINRKEVLHDPKRFDIVDPDIAEPLRDKIQFKVNGYELLEKMAVARGNSGMVHVPVKWIGEDVVVIRVSKRLDDD